MLIAWLEPPAGKVQGDQIYRTLQPAADLAQLQDAHVITGSWLEPLAREAAEEADVCVLAQCVEVDLLPLIHRRRRRGRATIYEINDDFLDETAAGEVAGFYRQSGQAALTLALAGQADALQTSSPYLATRFRSYARQTVVFANAAQQVQPLPPPRGDGELRLGWGGSAGHAEDLRRVMPALRALLDGLPALKLYVMAPRALHPLFAWVPRDRLQLRADGPLADYLQFLRQLDIGIAPLRDTAFNRGRSDVKFLEYAGAGAVALVQRTATYAAVQEGVLGACFDSNAELVAQVQTLAAQPAHRAALRQAAHAYVAAQRSRPAMAQARSAFLRAQALACWQRRHRGRPRGPGRATETAGAAGGRAPASAAQRFLALRARAVSDRVVPSHAQHLRLALAGAPAHLYNGLLQQARGGCGAQDFARAQALAPNDYLGHLYRGHHGPGDGAALRRARQLAPQSLAVTTALAQQALQRANFAGVLALWRARPTAEPVHPPLALMAHAALDQQGADTLDLTQPLRLVLAAQLTHPAATAALVQLALTPAHRTALPSLVPWALAAARRALVQTPQNWCLTLAVARLLRLSSAWQALWRLLAPLGPSLLARRPPPPAGETARALCALCAQAAYHTGQRAAARRFQAALASF